MQCQRRYRGVAVIARPLHRVIVKPKLSEQLAYVLPTLPSSSSAPSEQLRTFVDLRSSSSIQNELMAEIESLQVLDCHGATLLGSAHAAVRGSEMAFATKHGLSSYQYYCTKYGVFDLEMGQTQNWAIQAISARDSLSPSLGSCRHHSDSKPRIQI